MYIFNLISAKCKHDFVLSIYCQLYSTTNIYRTYIQCWFSEVREEFTTRHYIELGEKFSSKLSMQKMNLTKDV